MINHFAEATRRLPVNSLSDNEPGSKGGLTGPDGSPAFGDGMEWATRHLYVETFSRSDVVSKDAPVGFDGAPLQTRGDSSKSKGLAKGFLGGMIRQFKSCAMKRTWSLPGYDHLHAWQRNYYEHIIRGDPEWDRICEYIRNNPRRWEEEQLRPNAPNNPYE